ncbi:MULTISPECIES: hypothetical protein [unclassified Sedimentibacter]|uniref:hypothetical protein n=1 Tax=unclassified Sedimentibacter TaxID=2649220 RepID=UPI0027E06B87|nr:hypothetical protein [Sedimentibacter sp. MB35-C1]WMJ76268.1 hypothetical protein RBQ61_11605 [Sedimentibacter sp. MB35-C1]
MSKENKKSFVILICSIIIFILSVNIFTFTVNSAYKVLIDNLSSASTDYLGASSISPDKLKNIDIALSNLEVIRSETSSALLSKLLNTKITPENINDANSTYVYITYNHDEIKPVNIQSRRLYN